MTTLRIAVLPSAVANQIAAGEVVERPASVVKELVENALDAGATTIEVTVTEGGRTLVRVADDGHGMERDDAEIAVERHATSKIRSAADLVGVASFGFRGEALPAIGSVSRLEIETATSDGSGTRVRVVGGQRESVAAATRRRGTTVSVEGLFFNTPARHKFMKGVRSEWRAIQETMTAIALARRDVRLTMQHDGREAMTLPLATTLRDRVAALWGAAAAESLVGVDDVSGPIRVAGLVETPSDVGLASRRIFVSVNGRAVRDHGLSAQPRRRTAQQSRLVCGRPCFSKSRCQSVTWTSTCIRPRPRCVSAIDGAWSARWNARCATRSVPAKTYRSHL